MAQHFPFLLPRRVPFSCSAIRNASAPIVFAAPFFAVFVMSPFLNRSLGSSDAGALSFDAGSLAAGNAGGSDTVHLAGAAFSLISFLFGLFVFSSAFEPTLPRGLAGASTSSGSEALDSVDPDVFRGVKIKSWPVVFSGPERSLKDTPTEFDLSCAGGGIEA